MIKIKVKSSLKENKDFYSRLKYFEKRDQDERNEYLKNYLQPLGYEKGVAKWIKDKNRTMDDVFDDKPYHAETKKIIRELIKIDEPLEEEMLDLTNILVIHMDEDRSFQKEFLQFLTKHHYMSGPFKSISDRVSCAESGTQKYGTQNGCEPDKNNMETKNEQLV
jgi:16S rRNA G966 N2-methylase RsmD